MSPPLGTRAHSSFTRRALQPLLHDLPGVDPSSTRFEKMRTKNERTKMRDGGPWMRLRGGWRPPQPCIAQRSGWRLAADRAQYHDDHHGEGTLIPETLNRGRGGVTSGSAVRLNLQCCDAAECLGTPAPPRPSTHTTALPGRRLLQERYERRGRDDVRAAPRCERAAGSR